MRLSLGVEDEAATWRITPEQHHRDQQIPCNGKASGSSVERATLPPSGSNQPDNVVLRATHYRSCITHIHTWQYSHWSH